MKPIDKWLKIAKSNGIHACNRTSSKDVSACFNFIQLPDTDTVVLTLTVTKNGIKKNALEPGRFRALMNQVEDALSSAYIEFEEELKYPEYFCSLKSDLSTDWYVTLCCHRVFFIPEKAVFSVIQHLFTQDHTRYIKECGINEIAVYVNTEQYDFNGKFY